MGILNLNQYVDKHQLKIPYRLQHTKLIIDGNIFSKYLFNSLPSLSLKYFYGGDYTDLKAHVRVFFDKLTNCNVEPIVIFDGCSKMELEQSARLKIYQITFAKRLQKAIAICERGQVGDPKNQPTAWPSVSTVLFQVLRELGVVHRQCVTKEADDVIPVLARYYQCPVLTMDSDFLLWDLPGGLISMFDLFEKYLNFSESTSSKYIECSIYYCESGLLEHLESKYGFKPEMLPLVGPLLGYDHVDAQIAMRFAGHARRDQLNKLTSSFEARIRSIVKQFTSQLNSSFKERVIAGNFAQSTLCKLDSSIERFSSVSERELENVEQNLLEKLDQLQRSQDFSEIQSKLNEIEQKFIEDLILFEESVKKPNDSHNFRSWNYDRVPAVFRWLSLQSSFAEAKKMLEKFSYELKLKNNRKNFRFNQISRFVLESAQFDNFMKHVNNEIPVSLLYEHLDAQIHALEPDLPIERFLDQMYNELFPQEPEIPFSFHHNLTRGFTNPYLLNILYTKVDLCGALIEDYSTKSSYACKFDLDPYIYGIILNQNEEVTRIYREGTKQVQIQVQPKFEINGKRLPNLEQISNMTESDRRNLLFTIIQQVCFTSEVNIDELMDTMQTALPSLSESVLDAFVLMILSLIMCTHKCHSQLTCSPKWNHFRSAMLLNIVALGYIGHEHSDVPTFLDLDREKIELFRNKFADQSPPTIDLTITHYFNSYHNCLQSLNFLTQLLNLYECFQFDRFVCGLQGSFVHAMTQQFENDESYYEIFLESMNLSKAINKLLIAIQKIVK